MTIGLEIWITGGAVLILLLLSAFFSGSETALTAASRARMHSLQSQGDPRATKVVTLHKQKDRLIGAILFGNNVVNILASALATALFLKLFGDAGVAYATAIMTFLVLVFSEVMPKTYAISHADSTALKVAGPITVVVRLFGPVVTVVQLLVKVTLGLFGIKLSHGPTFEAHEEELRGVIELHKGADPEIAQERRMLRSILDLDDVEVGEIMTHRSNVLALDLADSPADIVEKVLESPFTRLPVYRDDPDNIMGVLHAKALLREVRSRGRDNLDEMDVKSVAGKPWFIPDTTTLLDQLQAFRERREHFALVVDEYGSFLGIVTLEDILEEIVGAIEDEHDVAVPGVRLDADGTYLIEGSVTLRTLNREFEWRLPDEDASTLAGLILHEARLIPTVGQRFAFHGFRFEIVKRQGNRITAIRVAPPGINLPLPLPGAVSVKPAAKTTARKISEQKTDAEPGADTPE